MQSILSGFGKGGRTRTDDNATPWLLAAASLSFARYWSKRAISPLIRSPGPVWGISRTTDDTSTTRSPFSTPNLKSSNNSSFISGAPSINGYEDTVADLAVDRLGEVTFPRCVFDEDHFSGADRRRSR